MVVQPVTPKVKAYPGGSSVPAAGSSSSGHEAAPGLARTASWPLLELPAAGTELPPGYALTFGVTGRTGTVGSLRWRNDDL
jgi:hypothetical protein